MMKMIWEKFSYAIVLLSLSLFSTIIIVSSLHSSNESDYLKVTVNQGESLWEISEDYANQHDLSADEFIEWVESKNGIVGDNIHPGDELLIPVSKDYDISTTDMASSVE